MIKTVWTKFNLSLVFSSDDGCMGEDIRLLATGWLDLQNVCKFEIIILKVD